MRERLRAWAGKPTGVDILISLGVTMLVVFGLIAVVSRSEETVSGPQLALIGLVTAAVMVVAIRIVTAVRGR